MRAGGGVLQRELHKEKPWGRWRPVRFKTQRTVWPVCKERGRMKGEEVARGPGSMLEMAEDTNRKKPTPEDVAEEPNNQLLNYANLQDYCDIR